MPKEDDIHVGDTIFWNGREDDQDIGIIIDKKNHLIKIKWLGFRSFIDTIDIKHISHKGLITII